jgi:hypothetical protein
MLNILFVFIRIYLCIDSSTMSSSKADAGYHLRKPTADFGFRLEEFPAFHLISDVTEI